MTKEEALKQGYTHCTNRIDGWSYLSKIKYLTEDQIIEDEWYLAEKKEQVYTVSSDRIGEILAEVISEIDMDESGRDNEDVYKAIKEMDFSDTQSKIQETLNKYGYYRLTDIKLTENETI